ncbi:hypothetical protein IU486_26765 [Streptomyces gardneri]|nr:hypothetical protein [Nocardia sputi]MBF6168326.1 hypothetical protein [Streptomyces gardneri]MBF6205820.1 hypothetical protein [Streptomyces gardneri]
MDLRGVEFSDAGDGLYEACEAVSAVAGFDASVCKRSDELGQFGVDAALSGGVDEVVHEGRVELEPFLVAGVPAVVYLLGVR